ncbi:hypothetical protein M569_08047, partial [Genlisea aurea]
SYLVCSMFEEAISSAYSVLSRLLANEHDTAGNFSVKSESEGYEGERYDLLESAGMVLVQSMKRLQREAEILSELKQLFGSVTAIPIQVFLTGVCFQISDTPSTDVQTFLEEFLVSCKCVIGDECYYRLVDLYVIKVLAKKDIDHAISWVEESMFPLKKHQVMMLKVESNFSDFNIYPFFSPPQELLCHLHSCRVVDASSQASTSSQPAAEAADDAEEGHRNDDTAKREILRRKNHLLWWFPRMTLKLGNARVTIPNAKIAAALALWAVYVLFMRKKRALAVFKRLAAEKGAAVKRAVVDFWQLAFSYQVNPLAAVQTLPA